MKLQDVSISRNSYNVRKKFEDKTIWFDLWEYGRTNLDKIALYWKEEEENFSMPYGELINLTIQVAEFINSKGIGENEIIGVSMPRCWQQIVVILGISISGRAYAPIRYQQPIERKESMCRIAGIKYGFMEDINSAEVVELSVQEALLINVNDFSPKGTGKELAYVIFTSGSTGLPKGVMITHNQACNTIQDITERFQVTSNDIAIGVSAVDFDLSVFDIFGMLSVGGSLVVLNEDEKQEAGAWIKAIQEFHVTTWNTVPVLFEMLISCVSSTEEVESLSKIFLSGDWVRPKVVKNAKEVLPHASIVAMGGATEAAIWSNYFIVGELDEEWVSIPYGYPLSNQIMRITDDEGFDVENGIEGNLWIGGESVAMGYIADEILTNEKFMCVENARWYATGDRGKFDDEGKVIFLGRKDEQEKVNGYRIELGEIEYQLTQLLKAKSYVWVERNNVKSTIKAAYKLASKTPKYNNMIKDVHKLEMKNEAIDNAIHIFLQNILESVDKEKETTHILEAWKFWLDTFEPTEIVDEKFLNILLDKKEQFVDTAKGLASGIWLLEDEQLSIQNLAKQDSETQRGIEETCQTLKAELELNVGVKKIAIIKPSDSVIDVLVDMLKSVQVKIVCWIENPSEYNYIKHKYNDKVVDVQMLSEYMITEREEFSYDYVLAINGMHQFKNPIEGLNIASLLLKTSGKIYITEQKRLPVVGLISSVLLESGFYDYLGRSEKYSPMLEVDEWKKYMSIVGIQECQEVGNDENSNLFILKGIVNRDEKCYSSSEIIEYLAGKLPEYMKPESISVLYTEPISANGKVDKKKLCKEVPETSEKKVEPLITEMEKNVAHIWSELLLISEIGRSDSFFEIGGDSLQATRFLNSVKQKYDVTLLLREMLETPKLSDIADLIEERENWDEYEEGEI